MQISFSNGRYWIRTSDPFRVKEVRYRCANRPHSQSLKHHRQSIGHHGLRASRIA